MTKNTDFYLIHSFRESLHSVFGKYHCGGGDDDDTAAKYVS